MATVDVAKSFGALLIGGLFATLLSGFVHIQVIVYYKVYPQDHRIIKILVFLVWLFDTSHTICVWLSLWHYLIEDFGVPSDIDSIAKALAISVILPAMLTILVHLFFARRIFMLSKRNLFLTIPIVILAVLRLVSATSTTAYMLKLGTFTLFKRDVRWLFSTGLALSTMVDIIIALSLSILLHKSRTGADKSNAVIDSLITYTFETGALTCAGTIASMLCWSVMSSNLVFMGLHFVIGKLYATSLLVTLNSREGTREKLRHARSGASGEHGHLHLVDAHRQKPHRDSDDILMLSGIRSESKAETAFSGVHTDSRSETTFPGVRSESKMEVSFPTTRSDSPKALEVTVQQSVVRSDG